MITDADIEMAELESAGNDIANGVCPICDDMLDPLSPRWPDSQFEQTQDRYGNDLHPRSVYRMTRQRYAQMVGPYNSVVEGFHDDCAREAWGLA